MFVPNAPSRDFSPILGLIVMGTIGYIIWRLFLKSWVARIRAMEDSKFDRYLIRGTCIAIILYVMSKL